MGLLKKARIVTVEDLKVVPEINARFSNQIRSMQGSLKEANDKSMLSGVASGLLTRHHEVGAADHVREVVPLLRREDAQTDPAVLALACDDRIYSLSH